MTITWGWGWEGALNIGVRWALHRLTSSAHRDRISRAFGAIIISFVTLQSNDSSSFICFANVRIFFFEARPVISPIAEAVVQVIILAPLSYSHPSDAFTIWRNIPAYDATSCVIYASARNFQTESLRSGPYHANDLTAGFMEDMWRSLSIVLGLSSYDSPEFLS